MFKRLVTSGTVCRPSVGTFAAVSGCGMATPARFCATANSTDAPNDASNSTIEEAKRDAHGKKIKKKGSRHPSLMKGAGGDAADVTGNDGKAASWFTIHRERTLKDLDANNNDKSNAGRVDPLILPSVNLINSYPHYCTASSCSGRVSVFHRAMPVASGAKGVSKPIAAPSAATTTDDSSAADLPMDVVMANKKRGNGLGTVFSSHDPLEDTTAVAVQVYKDLVAARVPITAGSSSNTNPHALTELLQVKFEPTILHTTCETMSDAHRFIAAASESGHRTTGIVVSRAGKEVGGATAADASSTTSVINEVAGSSAAAADVTSATEVAAGNSDADEMSPAALKALEGISEGWKITAKMQSMVCFDAPLYTATSGWLLHGGHAPLPDIFAGEGGCTAEEKAIGEAFIASLDRLLKHGNALFAENVSRRERFMGTLKQMEDLAARKASKK